MQSIPLPRGQKINTEIKSPKININFSDVKDIPTVKEILGI